MHQHLCVCSCVCIKWRQAEVALRLQFAFAFVLAFVAAVLSHHLVRFYFSTLSYTAQTARKKKECHTKTR